MPSWIQTLLVVIGALTTVVPVLPAAFTVVMGSGGGALTMDVTSQRVRLCGRDGLVVTAGLLAALTAGGVAYLAGLPPVWSVVLATVGIVGSFGSRFRLEVAANRGRLERRVLWHIPWKTVALARPSAWVDGWGDWADPLAIYVGDAHEDGFACEVAWSTKGDDAEALLSRFERAAGRLRERGRGIVR